MAYCSHTSHPALGLGRTYKQTSTKKEQDMEATPRSREWTYRASAFGFGLLFLLGMLTF